MLEQETTKGIDTLAAKTRKVAEQASRLPGGQAQELAAMTEPEEYMVRRPLSELEHWAAQWMLEEFKARNQVAYERYDSLTKQEQKIIDRWQALEYRLNPPAAPVSGNQNNKLFGRNDPYGIIDTRQAVGYDKGKEGRGNELSPAGQGWAQPNQTKPGTPNAYAEYLAYKQKIYARQQSLALEQVLQELLVQEQAARAVAGPQAFAYNGADGFTSGSYETGDATGSGGTGGSGGVDGNYGAGDLFKPGGLDSGAGADSVLPAAGTGEGTGRILSEGDCKSKGSEYKDALDSLSDNNKHHILQEKHSWDKVVDNPKSWDEVSDVLSKVLEYGTETPYGNTKNVFQKVYNINGSDVLVKYLNVNGKLTISDAWVMTR